MRTFVALAALLPATADAFMVAPFAPAPLMQQLQRPHFLGLDDWFFDPFRSAVSGLDAGPTQVRDVTKPLQPVLAVDFVETENDYQIHAGVCGPIFISELQLALRTPHTWPLCIMQTFPG